MLLLLFWTGLCVALFSLSSSSRHHSEAHFLGVLAAPAYALLFLSLPLLVGRLPRSDRLASPAVVRVLFFSLVGLAGALLPLVAVLFDQTADDPLVNLLNPFVGLANFGDYDYTMDEPTDERWSCSPACGWWPCSSPSPRTGPSSSASGGPTPHELRTVRSINSASSRSTSIALPAEDAPVHADGIRHSGIERAKGCHSSPA